MAKPDPKLTTTDIADAIEGLHELAGLIDAAREALPPVLAKKSDHVLQKAYRQAKALAAALTIEENDPEDGVVAGLFLSRRALLKGLGSAIGLAAAGTTTLAQGEDALRNLARMVGQDEPPSEGGSRLTVRWSNDKIARKIRDARREHGLTQEAVGQQLGVHRRTISSWETGGRRPSPMMLASIADLLEIEELYDTEAMLGLKEGG